MGGDRKEFRDWLKRVIGLDPAVDEDHLMEIAKFLTVWQAADTRNTVEVCHNAHRAINQLLPQLTEGDLVESR